MKAFALANQQGQKIYTVTQDNYLNILPKIQASSLTKGDIRSSVMAGKTVTVHEREVSVPGWTGTGYMVIDPNNSNGAYLISGGGNGGFLDALGSLVDNILDNLDEIGAIFHHIPIIKLIAEQLDNFMDLLNVYKERGVGSLLAGVAILVMIMSITSLMAYALALGIGLAGASLSGGIAWAAMTTLYYAMANIFNIIVP